MKYYGFMVSELTGEVDELETDVDYKPKHERCGFSYAKWFKTKNKRNKTMEYTKKQIQKYKKMNDEKLKKE